MWFVRKADYANRVLLVWIGMFFVCSLCCLLVVCLGCVSAEMIITFLHWIWVTVPLWRAGCKALGRQPEANSSVSSFCLSKNIKHVNQWAIISYLIFYPSISLSCCTASQMEKIQQCCFHYFFFFSSGFVNYCRGKVKSIWKPLL